MLKLKQPLKIVVARRNGNESSNYRKSWRLAHQITVSTARRNFYWNSNSNSDHRHSICFPRMFGQFSDWRREIGKFFRGKSTHRSKFFKSQSWIDWCQKLSKSGDGWWREACWNCIGCTFTAGQITICMRWIRGEFREFFKGRIEFIIRKRADAVSNCVCVCVWLEQWAKILLKRNSMDCVFHFSRIGEV